MVKSKSSSQKEENPKRRLSYEELVEGMVDDTGWHPLWGMYRVAYSYLNRPTYTEKNS